jgi:serine/threonine-protein kinase
LTSDASDQPRELLRIRAELSAVSSFEPAVRERLHHLAHFRHPYFAPVVSVDRASGDDATLSVVSERVEGIRLSALFKRAAVRGLNLDINAALCLIRQLMSAIARLHESCGDLSHGALGPERVVLTSSGRLMVTEYVLGAALEQLRYSQERYWRELRVAVPHSAGLPRFDHRTDVTQIGVIALSLVLGRTLRDDEYPARVGDVVMAAKAIAPRGGFEPLPLSLRGWLSRALQLDVRQAFGTATEAHAELERVVADLEYPGLPASVDAFLTRFREAHAFAPLAESAPEADALVASFTAEADLSVQVAPPRNVPSADRPFIGRDSLASDFTAEAELLETAAGSPLSPVLDRCSASAVPLVVPELFASDVRLRPGRSMVPVGVGVALAVAVAAVPMWGRLNGGAPDSLGTGTLVISTVPRGAAASLDGRPIGVTPLTVTVLAGSHTVEVRGEGEPRTVPVVMTAGTRVEQYFELPASTTASGEPMVPLSSASAPIVAGTDPQVATPPAVTPPQAPPTGWLIVKAPIDLVIEEDGIAIGNSATERVTLPSGRHVLTLRNEALGFQTTRTVHVHGDAATTATVDVPSGALSLNASPWAEVWLDGARVGDTPLGNLTVPIGAHEVVLRHPELGEHRRQVIVAATGVARLSIDLRERPATN